MKTKIICMSLACFSATLLFWIGVLAFSENYVPYIIDKAQAIANIDVNMLTEKEKLVFNKALVSGELVDVKSFVDSISSFYTSVINILIFLVSLTTIMVAVYLRQRTDEVSKEAAEKTAKEMLTQQSERIFKEAGFSDKIQRDILPRLVDRVVRENIETLQEDLEKMKTTIENIQGLNGGEGEGLDNDSVDI